MPHTRRRAAQRIRSTHEYSAPTLTVDVCLCRAARLQYNDDVQADEDTKKMSPELQSLMRHMHSYATRYNVDLYRSLKENGGKQSSDGHGAMAKTKFQSVLLSAFNRSARRAAGTAVRARRTSARAHA